MSARPDSDVNGVDAANQAREELYDTLSKLRDRLDYAARIDRSVERTKQRIAEGKRENPAMFVAGVVGVAAVCGIAVWGIARQVIRVFSDD